MRAPRGVLTQSQIISHFGTTCLKLNLKIENCLPGIFKLRLGASIGRFVRRSVGHSVTLLVRGKKSESQYLSLCMSDLNQI